MIFTGFTGQMAILVGLAGVCCVGLVGVMMAAAWMAGRRKRSSNTVYDPEGRAIVIKSARFLAGKMGLSSVSVESHDISPIGEINPFTLATEKQSSLKILSPLSPQETRLVLDGGLPSAQSEGGSPKAKHKEITLEEENMPLGTLDLTVSYDSAKSMLVVCIVRANDLPAKDSMLGTSDPYVKLQLLPEKRHRVKTRVLRRTLNPVYEESFTFYGIGREQLKQIALHLVVLSFDRFSRDDIIGECLCPLAGLEVLDKDASLHLDIQPRHLKLSNQSRGELLVSLCHQPAANRLTVVVLKARNLPKMDVTGLAGDPYVKIYLLVNGQRVAKKKTHVKKRTLNPVYNESFVFEIPANLPNSGSEGESSASLGGIGSVGLELQVLDWDRVTKNETIGRVVLGLSEASPGRAQTHWRALLDNPRRQIAEWHGLYA